MVDEQREAPDEYSVVPLLREAQQQFRDVIDNEHLTEEEYQDRIPEIAASVTEHLVFTQVALRYALDDLSLATGMPRQEASTPAQAIHFNVVEIIEDALFEMLDGNCNCENCAVCGGRTICAKCRMCARCHEHKLGCPGCECETLAEEEVRI